jgi:hypothetical protein
MKRFLNQRSRREKVLVLVLALAGAVVWLSSALGRARDSWRDGRSVAVQLEDQNLWLERKTDIENRAAIAVRNLDPAKTLDLTHLVGEVSALAAQAQLSPSIDSPRTQRTEDFAYHTVQVTFRRTKLPALITFYRELNKRAPYLALEQCAIVADRSNPADLNATFSIFSVEVVRGQ